MKTCKHCRLEMPTSAQKCPNCLEDGNEGYGMIGGWLVMALGAYILFSMFFG